MKSTRSVGFIGFSPNSHRRVQPGYQPKGLGIPELMSRGKGTAQDFAHLGKVRMHGEPGDGGEPYSGVAPCRSAVYVSLSKRRRSAHEDAGSRSEVSGSTDWICGGGFGLRARRIVGGRAGADRLRRREWRAGHESTKEYDGAGTGSEIRR